MNMTTTYLSLSTDLEVNANTIKGLKKQVGISLSLNYLGCPCEVTYGCLLHGKSRLHSDLYMFTLVVDLTQMKFLSMRSTGSEEGTGYIPSLLFKRNFCSLLKIFLLN